MSCGRKGDHDPRSRLDIAAIRPRLDLLSPDPWAWTGDDLATGLSRTYCWGGYSAWDLPLSVAQHSLTVLALCPAAPGPGLTDAKALRELLHDAVEALLGGWDPITPSSRIWGTASRGWSAACKRRSTSATRCRHGPM
ncbi:MAG TPA: hypothetical protein VIJ55_04480, partial [Acetobacteraceae bacterium]